MKRRLESGFIIYTENDIQYMKNVEILKMRDYLIFRSLISEIEIRIPKNEIHQVLSFSRKEVTK